MGQPNGQKKFVSIVLASMWKFVNFVVNDLKRSSEISAVACENFVGECENIFTVNGIMEFCVFPSEKAKMTSLNKRLV